MSNLNGHYTTNIDYTLKDVCIPYRGQIFRALQFRSSQLFLKSPVTCFESDFAQMHHKIKMCTFRLILIFLILTVIGNAIFLHIY